MENEGEIRQVAIGAAKKAGIILKKYFGKISVISYKAGTGNIVTSADKEVESVIVKTIRKHFPEHNILAEEGTNFKTKSSYLWSVDPLDGTLPFTQGLPYWSVSIGVLKNNRPIFGVVYIPYCIFGKDELYTAARGEGAYLNGRRICVKNKRKLEDSIVGFDFAYTKREERIKEILLKIAPQTRYTIMLGWATGSLCYVAQGIFDAYINQNLEHWDIAASSLIVEEAGGKVSNLHGKNLVWDMDEQFDFIASNGQIHNKLLSTLTSVHRDRDII